MFKRLLAISAFVIGAFSFSSSADAVPYDQVFASPSTIGCSSDASCNVLDHVRVRAVTYSGNAGSGVYTWTATCASAPDAVFYIRPTGATTGCFQMDGFSSSSAPLTGSLTSAHILVGNASNVATSVAMSGTVAIDNTGATSIPLNSTNILVGNASNVAAAVAVSGDAALANTGTLSVTKSQGQPIVTTVASIAALSALASPSSIAHISVQSYFAGGTVGGGNFDYSSAALTDDGCTIFPASDGKHWVRQGVASAPNCGSKYDGSTDVTSTLQAGLTSIGASGGGTFFAPPTATSSFYSVLGQLSIPANTTLDCQGGEIDWNYPGSSGLTAALITLSGNNAKVQNCVLKGIIPAISGFTCYLVNYGSSVDGTAVIRNTISNTVGVGCNLININAASITNTRIEDDTLTGGGYGILFGSSASSGHDAYIGNIKCSAVFSDCIEINTTTNNFPDITISGGTLDSTSAGASSSSGFCIGIAGATDLTVTGVTMTGCRQEAIHIEVGGPSGATHRIAITGNVINQTVTGEPCINIIPSANTPAATIPFGEVTITGNVCRANTSTQAAPLATGSGIIVVGNGSATQPISFVICNNTITGFDVGFQGGGKNTFCNNTINLVYDGTNAVTGMQFSAANPDNYELPTVHDNTVGFTVASGVASCSACKAVVFGKGGIMGHLTIYAPASGVAGCYMPSAVASSGGAGGIINGLTLKGCWTHASGTDTTAAANTVPSPSRYSGYYAMHINNHSSYSTNYANYSAIEQYNGSADSTIGTAVGTAGGTFSAPTLVMTGGNVLIGITSTTTGQTDYTVNLEGNWISP